MMPKPFFHHLWYNCWLRWPLWFFYAAGIFYLSSRPWPLPSGWPVWLDKIVHIGLYFVFAVLTLWSLRLTRLRHQQKIIWLAWFLVALYGASDEWHQHFVPGRSMSIWDWYADLFGSGLGAQAGWLVAKWKERNHAVKL